MPSISNLVSDDTESRQADLSFAEPTLEQFRQMVAPQNPFEGSVIHISFAETTAMGRSHLKLSSARSSA